MLCELPRFGSDTTEVIMSELARMVHHIKENVNYIAATTNLKGIILFIFK